MNRLLISSLTFTSLATAAAAASLCAGCADDVAEPYELTHPRVLAIRTEPAAIPAEGEAALDVLFTDGVAPPRLAAADELELTISVALPGGVELSSLIVKQADGWRVRAPDEATLDLARAQLGLPAGAAVPLPLDVRLRSETASLLAQKAVPLGTFVGNPEAPKISIADQPATGEMAIPTGSEISLQAALPDSSLAGPPDGVTYRWFSSAGELRRYTQPLALLEASAADAGAPATLLVVARTAAGGVSWTLVSLLPLAPGSE